MEWLRERVQMERKIRTEEIERRGSSRESRMKCTGGK